MNIAAAKELDMVQYLSQLGYEPTYYRGKEAWYHSPLRNEKTPSFTVNQHTNEWYDFGEAKGGNLVDFGILYHKCSVAELLEKLSGPAVAQTVGKTTVIKEPEPPVLTILSEHPITSVSLRRYLHSRRIEEVVADKFCKEVRYQTGGKKYYALGFKNDAGGYELRSQYFKGSSSPKDVTLIDNGAKDLAVYEGFFDFLSAQSMLYLQQQQAHNFLILNTAAFFEKSLPIMQSYNEVHLYLDNDSTGQKYTDMGLKTDPQKFRDERSLYAGYKDLNEWIVQVGTSQKQGMKHKL